MGQTLLVQMTAILLLLLTVPVFAQVALEFDGIDDFATAASDSVNTIGEGDFTMEAWVKALDSDQGDHAVIMSSRTTSSNGFMLFFHNNWGGSVTKLFAIQMSGIK